MYESSRENSFDKKCLALSQKLNYQFHNPELLTQALTHKSYHNEFSEKSTGHNERLEFLGDAVLDLALSDFLMRRFSEMSEGELSKIRASLVNEATLSEMALELGIEKCMRLGKGEHQSGGALKPRILACAFEALLAAIYIDSDFDKTKIFIETLFASRIHSLDLETHFKSDYKTRLQEKLQSTLKKMPVYQLAREEGPDHNKIFFVELMVNDSVVAHGQGRSKKQAEQEAARLALEVI